MNVVSDIHLQRRGKLHPVDFLRREKCSTVNADPVRDEAVNWELVPGYKSCTFLYMEYS